MKRLLGFLALVLGIVGLAACLAGLIAGWVVRPQVLRSSQELLEAADDGLKVVDERTTRADEVVTSVKQMVDPIARKVLELAEKAQSTRPEDKEQLKQIEAELAERLHQVDLAVQASERVVALLNKTSRLTTSLPLPTARGAAGQSAEGELQGSAEVFSRLAEGLKALRKALAKVREDKQVQKEIADRVVSLGGDVEKELNLLHDRLRRVRQRAAEFQKDVSDLRTDVPFWINSGVVLGSVVLAWMALGQWALLRRGWSLLRKGEAA
jgi:hypothetical protein